LTNTVKHTIVHKKRGWNFIINLIKIAETTLFFYIIKCNIMYF